VYLDDAVVTGRAQIRASTRSVLDEYELHYGTAPLPDGGLEDPGPLVLAALLRRIEGAAAGSGAARLWAHRSRYPGPYVLGLFDGGLSGHLLALATAADAADSRPAPGSPGSAGSPGSPAQRRQAGRRRGTGAPAAPR
jgi:hypothetical protein